MWESGPKTHQLQFSTGLGLFINQTRWRKQLGPIDTEGGSILDLVQTFCFWGALSLPQVTFWKRTFFSQQPCSPFIQFVPSFFPSFFQPTSLLYLGTQRETGSVPVLREQQAGTHQLPFAPLLLSIRYRSDPQEPLAQGPSGLGRVPDGETHTHTQTLREKEIVR